MTKPVVKIAFSRDGVCQNETEHSPFEAMRYLVRAEFGFSGLVIELEETKVSVETVILGNMTDLSVFTGTKEAMALVFKAACIYMRLIGPTIKAGKPFSAREVKYIAAVTEGVPRLIEMGAGIFAGAGRAKLTFLAMLDLKSEEEIDRFVKLRSCDLESLNELKYQDNLSHEEILEIASSL